MAALFAIAALAGVAIGIISGMLGVGGGTMMIPIFSLAFGMSGIESTATSLFTIIPTSLSGAITHIRAKTCVPKLGLALGIGGACTSPLGAMLADNAPDQIVLVGAAVCIAYSGFTMMKKAFSAPKSARSQPRTTTAPDLPAPPDFERCDFVKAFAIGALTGLISGFVGLGGGFIMVPLMLSLLNMPMKLTSGTSLIAIILLAIPAAITQFSLGNVNFLVGIAIACGSIPGALIGARLMRHVPERTLRFLFAAFLLVAAVLLVIKQLGFFA